MNIEEIKKMNGDELRKKYLDICNSDLPEYEKSFKQKKIEEEFKERVHKLTA